MRRGPAPLSSDTDDKLMAALHWHIGEDKDGATYVTAPHYFDAALAWFRGLSIDGQERAHTVREVCLRPGWGERVARDYAALLPPAPRYPLKPSA